MSSIDYIFSVFFSFLMVCCRNGSNINKGFNAVIGNVASDVSFAEIRVSDEHDDAFEISYHLDVPVREDIYDYMVSSKTVGNFQKEE